MTALPMASIGTPVNAPLPELAITNPVVNNQVAPANASENRSHTTGMARENRNGKTPEMSGQRGMSGRPR